ncbi:MAG: hypothetical protein I8H91_09930 [Burkholderiales bacterium]|nr:hypothetical protein [Burkholderiales bacterium]
MINKIALSVADALADVKDGSTDIDRGIRHRRQPELIDGLIAQGAKDLTVVNNNAGNGEAGLAALLKAGRIVTPGIHVSRIVRIERVATRAGGIKIIAKSALSA